MILFVWGTILMVTFIPGAIVGWLVGKIPCPTGVCGALLVAGSALLGFAASEIIAPNQSARFHAEELLMNSPPILVAMLLGLWISRVKKRPPARPWYLPQRKRSKAISRLGDLIFLQGGYWPV
ncbi:hypothetical protein [Bradyrhizobium sp. CSS354]|uniref:hypothetical protein n=1 Tax=Bradyrhizobium sp. CSS354 TaxID=2699172 RepID=UPI0023AF2A6B|nr:hypothetical protein [Bradyrhizobium sp. CSS354]MDE5462262.1 hypothetical protein [Bradyrhizobium sp. CSS354]